MPLPFPSEDGLGGIFYWEKTDVLETTARRWYFQDKVERLRSFDMNRGLLAQIAIFIWIFFTFLHVQPPLLVRCDRDGAQSVFQRPES